MLGDDEAQWKEFLKNKNPAAMASIDESWEMHQKHMNTMRGAGYSETEILEYRVEVLETIVFRLCKVLA